MSGKAPIVARRLPVAEYSGKSRVRGTGNSGLGLGASCVKDCGGWISSAAPWPDSRIQQLIWTGLRVVDIFIGKEDLMSVTLSWNPHKC